MRYDIYERTSPTAIGKRIAWGRTIADAASATGLDEADVAWAIDECGQCDTDTRTITKARRKPKATPPLPFGDDPVLTEEEQRLERAMLRRLGL